MKLRSVQHGVVVLTAVKPGGSGVRPSVTSRKGQRLAAEMQSQLGRVIVPAAGGNVMSGADGRTTVSKVAAERDAKLAAARAALKAQDEAAAALTAEKTLADAQIKSRPKAKKIPAALNLVPTPKAAKGKATRPSLIPGAPAVALTVVQGQIPAGQKLCPTCKLVKDLDQFASDVSNKVDGRYYACKACGKIARERQAANRAAKAAAQTAEPVAMAATEQPKAKKARKK